MSSEIKSNSSGSGLPGIAGSFASNVEAWKINAVGVAALMAMSALAYLCGVRPLLDRHDLAVRQKTELSAARIKSADTQRAWAKMQQELADAQNALAAAPLRLQPVAALNQRLALVSDLAIQGGAGFDDVQPGKSTEGTRFDSLPIRITGTGSYTAFTALLHRLRQEFPDLGVTMFDIAGSAQNGAGESHFTVDLLWYTSPAKQGTRSPDKGHEIPGGAQHQTRASWQ
jgi:Tfp pilus assembly protein PilO